jgi:hypothetical protein
MVWSRLAPEIFAWERIVLAGAQACFVLPGSASTGLGGCGNRQVVTVGRGVNSRAAIAAKVTEATRFITGDITTFEDPDLAGAHLGRLLDQRPRTLLVLDDVWESEQLAPFLVGGTGACA